jgi:propionyl-CoA carboxylase alpha chain/3-methylcrotonyl-CoA carboxylase alpha subunit
VQVDVAGRKFGVAVSRRDALVRGAVGDLRWTGLRTADGFELVVNGYRTALAARTFSGAAFGTASETSGNLVKSTMPGTVVGLPHAVGDTVEAGDALVIVEAMKMENRVLAPLSGVVDEIRCAVNDLISTEQILVVLATETESEPAS